MDRRPIKWTNDKKLLSELKPWDKNPRRATEKQAKDLAASIKKFDLADPIIINQDGTIIGGHFRARTMQSIVQDGDRLVDVRIPDRQLSEDEMAELNVRLNKNTGLFDSDMLANFDEEMLLNVGFEANELDDIYGVKRTKGGPDDVPTPPEVAISHLGDLYVMGNHRLLCGDSTNTDSVMRLMGGGLAAMVFTDPPYNVNYSGKGENTSDGIMNDNLSPEEFGQFIHLAFSAMHRAMADGAVYYICSGWSSYPVFHQELINIGFYRAGVIIWAKNNASYGWNDFRYKHEWILVGKQKKRVKSVSILYGWRQGSHYFRDTRDEYDVWEIPRHKSSDYVHPTEKPVWLIEKALANSSRRGDVVLDLFGGSGSTLIGCERLGRQARLMEFDPIYCDVIVKRWEEFTGKKAELLRDEGQKTNTIETAPTPGRKKKNAPAPKQ